MLPTSFLVVLLLFTLCLIIPRREASECNPPAPLLLPQDGCLKLLREEAQVLSKSKRGVEHHLQTVKSHLQNLDFTRKTLQTKITALSRALELDAQNFKVGT